MTESRRTRCLQGTHEPGVYRIYQSLFQALEDHGPRSPPRPDAYAERCLPNVGQLNRALLPHTLTSTISAAAPCAA